MNEDQKAVQVRVTGLVQGVGFRDWTQREASRLGLCGWVRNERDGSVSAVIAGSESQIATMLERFEQGPRLAAVSGVTSEATDLTELPGDFRITS